MTHNIIKTENYLLVVDDSEVNINQYVYCDLGYIEKVMDIIDGWIYHTNTLGKNPIKHYKKIIAHLPLNNSPVLEGVPLLPPLEDDEAINKAKEKYKWTDEDLRKAIDMARKFPYIKKGEIKFDTSIDEIIQSLQQPKMPVAFECESTQYTVDEMSKLPLGTVNQKPKTTTNPQGQTVLVGKYIY